MVCPDGSRASQIDLIGCPSPWLPHVLSSDLLPCPVSDHCAVLVTLSSLLDSVPYGPGFWKLNFSILSDPDYVREITNFWSFWQDSNVSFSSLLDW